MKIAKDEENNKNIVDRRDVQIRGAKELTKVLNEELVNYPNKIKLKMKVSDLDNVQKEMEKAYNDYFRQNRTQYGNVRYVIRGNKEDGSFIITNSEDIIDVSFEIKYTHFNSGEEIPSETLRNYRAASEKVADDFVNKEIKNKNLSDAEKVLKINNYLVEKAEYNHESIKLGRYLLEDHISYGVLVKNIGVCESYAKAFDLLAKKSGLETIYVTGKAFSSPSGEGEDHAWNMVKIDGAWYNIDVTWNDIGEKSRYDYFLKSDKDMANSHQRDNSNYSYPEVNGSKDFLEELKLK